MKKINLHEAQNHAHGVFTRMGDPDRFPSSRSIIDHGMSELIQVDDLEAGKTYLYSLYLGDGPLATDVCVVNRKTGKMSVIPQESADLNAPWLDTISREEYNDLENSRYDW